MWSAYAHMFQSWRSNLIAAIRRPQMQHAMVNFNLYSVCGRIANNNKEGALNEWKIIWKKWQCHAITLAGNNNKSETDCECGRWKANNECLPAIEYHVNDTPYARSACEWQTLEFRSRSNAPTLPNAWCHKVVLWVYCAVNRSACAGRQFAFCVLVCHSDCEIKSTQLMNSCTPWMNDVHISIR